MIKECKDTVIDAEQDHKGRQYGSWLRLFQSLNPRRMRKASPQKNEKEKSPFESSAIKTGGFSLNERVAKSTENSSLGSNNKGKEDEEISNRQAPSPPFDLNLGPLDTNLIRELEEPILVKLF